MKSAFHATYSVHLDMFCSRKPYLAIRPPDIELVNDKILI
jgi:hypothetical protein